MQYMLWIKTKVIYGAGKYRIILIDCGVKNNIIRCLLNYDTTVIRVPWDYDFTQEEYDGVFISNGPGNPEMCKATIENLNRAMQGNKQMGHQYCRDQKKKTQCMLARNVQWPDFMNI